MLFVPLTVRAFGSVLVWKCQFSKYKIKAFHSSRKKIIIKLMKSIIIMKIQLSHAFPTVCSEKALCCLKQPAHNSICTFSHGVLMALIDPTDNINNKKRLNYRQVIVKCIFTIKRNSCQIGHNQKTGHRAGRELYSSLVVSPVEFGQEVGGARFFRLVEIAHYVGLLLPDVDRFLKFHFPL